MQVVGLFGIDNLPPMEAVGGDGNRRFCYDCLPNSYRAQVVARLKLPRSTQDNTTIGKAPDMDVRLSKFGKSKAYSPKAVSGVWAAASVWWGCVRLL